MTTKYFIEVEQFSLTQYRKILEKSELLSGRRILFWKIKECFYLLTRHGIKNLLMLVQAFRPPDKIKQLANDTGIPTDYFTILKREVNRLLPKPFSIADFLSVDKSLITKLNRNSINIPWNKKDEFQILKKSY